MSTEGLWKPPGAEPRECLQRQAPDGSTASAVPIPTVVHSKGKEKGLQWHCCLCLPIHSPSILLSTTEQLTKVGAESVTTSYQLQSNPGQQEQCLSTETTMEAPPS